jgi:nitrogen fixation/metabolism regulation signal transduction histidine kinase
MRGTEPFFTTKHHGTGLGLAIVERIIEVHHGELILQNLETGGASITLCFPYHHTNQSPTLSQNEQREHAA